MKGGTILIGGSAGLEVGMRMQRGIIVVGGPVRDFAGLQMKGGTIVLLSGAEIRTGRLDDPRHHRLAEAAARCCRRSRYACDYNPTFLRLYAKQLDGLGFAIPHDPTAGTYRHYTGDASVPGKGEILVWQPK